MQPTTRASRLPHTDLPLPAITQHRPGVGFAILHQGRGWHYLVLNWWDNENEWFSRVHVKPVSRDESWRRASNGEAACVWDLQVIWFEREMYVRHVLMLREGVNVDAYLAEKCEREGDGGASTAAKC